MVENNPTFKIFTTSDQDELLENVQSIMANPADHSKDTVLKAEMTYVQLGIIDPLAQEFIEAAGLEV